MLWSRELLIVSVLGMVGGLWQGSMLRGGGGCLVYGLRIFHFCRLDREERFFGRHHHHHRLFGDWPRHRPHLKQLKKKKMTMEGSVVMALFPSLHGGGG